LSECIAYIFRVEQSMKRDAVCCILYARTRFLNIFFDELHSGHAVASCLKHCTTNWKVAGSISNGVIGIFH
jgi:hypothetical protein